MKKEQKIILKPLISESDLKVRLGKLVKEIAHDFQGNQLVVVALLKGSFMFLADLVRHFYLHRIPLLIDFMMVSSYGSDTESSGKVTLLRDISTKIEGQWVLVVDDILDTGRTMHYVTEHLEKRKPRVLKTCVFLDKPARRIVPLKADFVGFQIPDRFVVGYGLDYDNRYRELPHLSVLSLGEDIPKGDIKT